MKPLCEPGLGERDQRRRRRPSPSLGAVEPADLQPAEVVGGALALAAARERDDRAVARARQLLELGLGLLEPARGDRRRLWARNANGWSWSMLDRRIRARSSSAAVISSGAT